MTFNCWDIPMCDAAIYTHVIITDHCLMPLQFTIMHYVPVFDRHIFNH